MKNNIFLSVILFFCCLFSFSQNEYAFTLEDSDGLTIEDNTILEFSSTTYPEASLNFFVRNNTSEVIMVRAEVTNVSGTDGSQVEFCFGECYFGVLEGQSYPIGNWQPVVFIEPGQTQISAGDHIYNFDLGDGENPIVYSFRFYMSDIDGNELMSIPELQTDYSMTYMYSSTLSNSSDNILDFSYSYSNNRIKISSYEPLNLELYSLTGQKLFSRDLFVGENFIKVHEFQNKIIVMKFYNEEGSTEFKKIGIY
tara:strand:+ start:4343 stop:5101 length:759 start_codon:yes stop_codon:yes gene_type:complete